MKCTHLKDLLEKQIPLLEKEIDLDKYYLSQRVGHDVGKKEAEADYLENHLPSYCAGFKDCYCNYVCNEKVCVYRRREE